MKSYHEGSKVVSIFEQVSRDDPTKLRLREHVSVHLYMSEPCSGDYGYYTEVEYVFLWQHFL